jgi:hypothetical protein
VSVLVMISPAAFTEGIGMAVNARKIRNMLNKKRFSWERTMVASL